MNMETISPDMFSLQSNTESMVQGISEFHYEPKADRTFVIFGKCEDVFRNNLTHIPDKEKTVCCYTD